MKRSAGLALTGASALAALTLTACHKNTAAPHPTAYPNGAYVTGSTNDALPVSRPAPPRGTYERVATRPPPPLPAYDQPPPPGDGYVWTPGYWAWSDEGDDYYWTPGAWVEPPEPGLYWTPGYWRYWDGQYLYSPGYWGPDVGFYGGVDYGWGYFGTGYAGGRWEGGRFWYNREANNLRGHRFDRVYSQPVPRFGNRASYNGGPSGVRAGPSPMEAAASRARHAPPTLQQREVEQAARARPDLRWRANGAAPPVAAISHPEEVRRWPGAAAQRAGAPPLARGGAEAATRPAPGSRAGMAAQAPAAPAARGWPGAAEHHGAIPPARAEAPRARAPTFAARPAEHGWPARGIAPPHAAAPSFRPPPAHAREFRAEHAAPAFHAPPPPAFHPHAAPQVFHAPAAPAFHAAPAAPAFHAPPAAAAHSAPAAPAFHPAAPPPNAQHAARH